MTAIAALTHSIARQKTELLRLKWLRFISIYAYILLFLGWALKIQLSGRKSRADTNLECISKCNDTFVFKPATARDKDL